MLRIYLVRHGVTVWNREGRMQGHTDVPLAREGLEQAQKLGARLANTPIDAVWSSDLGRALQTAEAIAAPHGITVATTPLLREAMLGEWEGHTEAEVIARGDEERWRAYRHDSIANRPPGGEELQAVWNRLLAALAAIRQATPSGTVVAVGHGGSLRVLVSHALGGSLQTLRRLLLNNASLSQVDFDADRTWLRLLNDTSHLNS